MVCSYKSTIPVWIEILSGNSSDKTSFRETIKKFTNVLQGKKEQWYVADSELYTEKNISELSEVSWVTRVPERIKEAKDTISELNHDELQDSNLEGYKYKQITSHYGGIKQRWLVVYSEKAFLREKETFDKNLVKQCEKAQKELWHLSKKDFACEADAEKAAKEIIRKWKFHTSEVVIVKKGVYKSKGRPSKASAPEKYVWNVTGEVVEDENAMQTALKQKGTFILGTNILDETKLTAEQLLDVYKSQNVSVERGFRFLKDPLFYAESLYLKSTKQSLRYESDR